MTGNKKKMFVVLLHFVLVLKPNIVGDGGPVNILCGQKTVVWFIFKVYKCDLMFFVFIILLRLIIVLLL